MGLSKKAKTEIRVDKAVNAKLLSNQDYIPLSDIDEFLATVRQFKLVDDVAYVRVGRELRGPDFYRPGNSSLVVQLLAEPVEKDQP